MRRPRQLSLDLPHPAALGRADFLVGDANREAFAVIDSWPEWRQPAVLLSGPPGSGKSHLAEIWRDETGGTRIAAAALADDLLPALVERGPVAVEDIDADAGAETALFHLLNLARETGAPILMTARRPAGDIALGLPDLASRIRALRQVALGPPDEALLARVFVKLLADRHLFADAATVAYAVRRMERSYAAAARLAARIDAMALAAGTGVTRPLVALVLDEEGRDLTDAEG